MSNRTNAPLPQNQSGVMGLLGKGQLVWRLLQDDRVPVFLRVGIPLLVASYFVMPLDLLPDFIPGLGQLDDIGVILLGMSMLINLAPRDVVDEHRVMLGIDPPVTTPPGANTARLDRNDAEVIEGTYRADDRP
jgi:uncharacterized membrane protein YkvA (DUF1232 family)